MQQEEEDKPKTTFGMLIVGAILNYSLFVVYMVARIVHVPIFWEGFPKFKVWFKEDTMIAQHSKRITLFIAAGLIVICFSWLWIAIYILIGFAILALNIVIAKISIKRYKKKNGWIEDKNK
jgi:hypothetical protein